jgi:hypothetical protein
MKGKKLMMTVVLAFFGFVFLGLSGYFLFKNSFNSGSVRALEEANKKINALHFQLEEKNKDLVETEQKIKTLKSDSFSESVGQNLPIVEIVDNDLSEADPSEEGRKKVHKLMYHHQIRFFLLNTGKNSLKEVIFSIKDDNNVNNEKKKKNKPSAQIDYIGKQVDNDEMGSYENIEVNTLNLKSKKLIYTSNLPGSFGVGDYSYRVIVEWSQGFYQMIIHIEEVDGKLKYNYEFFDVDGSPLDFKTLESSINK